MMYKGATNYKLLGAYVARKIGSSTIDMIFSKNSLNLNIFSNREDSTVKKYNKMFAGRCFRQKIIAVAH